MSSSSLPFFIVICRYLYYIHIEKAIKNLNLKIGQLTVVRRRERFVGLSSIIIIVYGCSHLFTLALNTEPRGPPDLLVTLCPILGQVLAVAGHLRAFCTPGLSEFKEYKKHRREGKDRWRSGWIEERTLGTMDAWEKWMVVQFTPHQTTRIFFQKLIFKSSLVHSSTFTKQQRRPLPSPLSDSFMETTQ